MRPVGERVRPLLRPLARALKEIFGADSRPRAPRKNPAILFEALEPRTLMSGDANPAAVQVSGSIDVAGQTNQYGFTLAQGTQVVFDSETPNANLNWTL